MTNEEFDYVSKVLSAINSGFIKHATLNRKMELRAGKVSYKELINLNLNIRHITDFDVHGKNLDKLLYGPVTSDIFDCSFNKLTSLEHGPRSVRKFYKCNNNKLTTLKYAAEVVNIFFDCDNNFLTNLEHIPRVSNGDIKASFNKLTSLYGIQSSIKGNLDISNNMTLTDLEYCPESILFNFNFRHTNVTTLKYFPKEVGGTIYGPMNLIDPDEWHSHPLREKFYIDIKKLLIDPTISDINKQKWKLFTG